MRDIPSATYECIGRIVTRWAYIDMTVGDILIALIGANDGIALIVTQGVSASTVTGWLRTMAEPRIASESLRRQLIDALDRIDLLRGQRNAYVHGLWDVGPEDDTATLRTIKWERREIVRDELVTIEDAKDFLSETGEVVGELLALHSAFIVHGSRPTIK